MAILFTGLKSKRWPNHHDSEKVIIVEGQAFEIYKDGEPHKRERYVVIEDFDLMTLLLEARAKAGTSDDVKHCMEVAGDVDSKPIISIYPYGDIVSVLLVNGNIKPLSNAH